MNCTKTVLATLAAMICAIALPVLGADESARIRAGNESWMKSFNAGNAGAVVALYADDAVLMPPNAPAARGVAAIKEAIAKDIAGMKKGGLTLAAATVSEVNVAGDMAWQAGTYVVKDKGGKVVEGGKFLEVWERKNGKWRIVRDIWNSDAAPAAPAAAAPAAEPKKK